MPFSPNALRPTRIEVRDCVLLTVRHVYNVECYDHIFRFNDADPERPHDIHGPNNKFEWPVLRGLSLAYRDRSEEFQKQVVLPARALHRCQHHHRCWNKPNDDSSPGDMRFGALDAICSLLEDRQYQGGAHTFPQIRDIIDRNHTHHRPWLIEIAKELYKLDRPAVHRITSLHDIPNIGVSRHMHDVIRGRVADVRSDLAKDHGIII